MNFLTEKENILKLIKKKNIIISNISEEFKDDIDIIAEAIDNNWLDFQYASSNLKNNKFIVLQAVKMNWYSLYWASKNMQNDKDIALEALKQNGYSLYFLSDYLKTDREIILTSLISFKSCLTRSFISDITYNSLIYDPALIIILNITKKNEEEDETIIQNNSVFEYMKQYYKDIKAFKTFKKLKLISKNYIKDINGCGYKSITDEQNKLISFLETPIKFDENDYKYIDNKGKTPITLTIMNKLKKKYIKEGFAII